SVSATSSQLLTARARATSRIHALSLHDALPIFEFLGRGDHQVKIRGYRVELGEIEATLRQHALVQEAVVLAREDVPGDRRLVAYVVATAEAAGQTSRELREFLQGRLPEYLVPAVVVVL